MPVTTPVVTTQNDPRHCCMSPARQNCSQARASALTHQTSPATAGGNPSLDCGPRPCPSCLQGSGGPSQSQGTRGSEAGWGRPHRDTSPGPSRWSCNRPGQQLPLPAPVASQNISRVLQAGRRRENIRFRGCGSILTKQRYCAEE